jgi:hypothetical protein
VAPMISPISGRSRDGRSDQGVTIGTAFIHRSTCDSSQYKIRIVALGANMNIFLGCPSDLHHKVGVANATNKTISASEIETIA